MDGAKTNSCAAIDASVQTIYVQIFFEEAVPLKEKLPSHTRMQQYTAPKLYRGETPGNAYSDHVLVFLHPGPLQGMRLHVRILFVCVLLFEVAMLRWPAGSTSLL